MYASRLLRAAVLWAGVAWPVLAAEVTLTVNGQPAATIVVAAQPTVSAQFAAFELQYHVRLISGATLPILREGAAEPTGVRILIGESSATAALGLPGQPWQPQEYLVRVRPTEIVLAGLDAPRQDKVRYDESDPFAFESWPAFLEPHATCYAVYDFLEELCDVRWFRPGSLGTSFTPRATLTVKETDKRRHPSFLYRDPGVAMGNSEGWDAFNGLWSGTRDAAQLQAISRIAYPELDRWLTNGWHMTHAKRGVMRLFMLRQRVGGEAYACNHSFYGFYNRFLEKPKDAKQAEQFVRPEPDWFAKGYEGQPPQMCYSNRDFTRQVVADANAYFDGKGKLPGAQAAGDYFALVPQDNDSFCKCKKCAAQIRPNAPGEGQFTNGRWSNHVFDFVNRVAGDVRKSHPDKTLSTLAYASYAFPPDFPVEPNVSVGFCLHIRNAWSTKLMENDHSLLKAWHDRDPQRRYFLFLYYTFPVENAADGWYCFPGFFAHALDREFKLYAQYGVRGAYFCGFGQDVEAYVTFRLLDDPSRNVDSLLDEYFKRQFGPAAEPLKRFYLAVEKIYTDPRSYPRDFASHQVEQVAWENLGTHQRMAYLGDCMVQARAAANGGTDDDRRRVDLFEQSYWTYMKTGYRQYWAKQWRGLYPPAKPVRIPANPTVSPVPTAAAFPAEPQIAEWWTETGEPVRPAPDIRLVHDGRNLYAWLRDAEFASKPGTWDFFFTLRHQSPGRRFRLNAATGEVQTLDAARKTLTSQAKLGPGPDGQGSLAIIPLAELLPEGVEPGWHLYGNLARVTDPDHAVVAQPNAVGNENNDLLRTFALDVAPGLPPPMPAAPAAGGTARKEPAASTPLPGVTVTTHDVTDLRMATDDALQGRPFVFAGKNAYYFHRDVYCPKDCLGLTDASSPRAPTDSVLGSGGDDVTYTWELGEPPVAGRAFKQACLWWDPSDSARCALKVQFLGRHKDGRWETVSPVIALPREVSPDQSYRAVRVDLDTGKGNDFTAFRMADLIGGYNPRYVELDLFLGAP